MELSKVHKSIGLVGLTLSGLTCIIGSGWLFGAYQATQIAGPAAIFSWIIDGIGMLFLVFTFIELGAMMPRVGGMVRYMEYTHGALAGFVNSWANWLAIVSVITVEAVASTQYLSSWPWEWAHGLFNLKTHLLTTSGILVSCLFLVAYFLVNYWSVKLFIRFVVLITIIKIIVPLMTIFLLFYTAFHPGNFTAYHNTIAPYGWGAALTAIATSGVALAYRGFQTIVNLSGEVKNPTRNIPLGMIFAILLAMALYVALQAVFIGAIDPNSLMNGWHNLNFSSPYADLAIALNLHVLLISLYVDAVISPSGVGIAYLGTTSRMLYGMSHNGYMPKFMGELHPVYGIPRKGLWVNLFVCFIFLWIFRGWANLVPIVSLLGIIAYLSGPVCSVALRRIASDLPRPIYVKGLYFFAPAGFVIISLILHWARWPLTGEVIFLMAIGLIIYFYYQYKQGWPEYKKQFKAGIWIIAYLFSVAFLSYVGSTEFGGKGYLSNLWDTILVIITSLIFYYWSIRSAWMTPSLYEAIYHAHKPEIAAKHQ